MKATTTGKVIIFQNFEERTELVQDVIDRLLSVPGYKEKLMKLNNDNPPLVDYNRRLEKSRNLEPDKVSNLN